MSDRESVFSSLETAVEYVFRDRELLATALRHASFAHERPEGESNERLEFLGDGVIGLVVARLLFDAHADWSEGDLTRALQRLVDRGALADLGRALDLGSRLQLGRTEESSGGADKDTILADAAEALIGALYLDGGLDPVERLARRHFGAALAPDAPPAPRDPKTELQERAMAIFGELPRYTLVDDSEIEGDEDRFRVRVCVAGETWGEGRGRSKQRAEKAAARAALPRAAAAKPASDA